MKTTFFIAVAAANLLIGTALGQTFERSELAVPGGPYFSRYHWVDFNADGAYDILDVDPYSGGVLHLSEGDGFVSVGMSFENLYFSEDRCAFNDYDGDGDVDILATQGYSIVIVNFLTGGGFSLQSTGIKFTDADYGNIYWNDIDGDLDLDIIHGRKIFLNNQGAYSESRFKIPASLFKMVFDDVNGDGLTDLVGGFGYDSYDGSDVHVFINHGEGNFDDAGVALPGTNLKANTMALIDADADSDIDVFVSDMYMRNWIFKSSLAENGQLQFTGTQISNIYLSKAIAGDINSDGLKDLVLAGPESFTVLRNTSASGSISFAGTSLDIQVETLLGFDLVDIDGDSDLDIPIKGYSYADGAVNVAFINSDTPGGSAPAAPVNLSEIVERNVSLSWTSFPGLLYNIEVKRNGAIYKPSCTSSAGRLLVTTGSFLLRNGSLTLRGLPDGSYQWRVQALDPSGRASDFSIASTFSVDVAPSSLTLEAFDLRNIKLCWSYTGPGTPSFGIFRGPEDGPAVEIAQVGAGINCYEDSTVPENQSVEYFVVAIHGEVYSAPSNKVVHHSSLFIESPFGTSDPNIISAQCFPADFDMDGDYDLEFIGRVSSIDNNFLLKANGDGSFTPNGSILPANSIYLPFTEMTTPRDLDNDGDPDFAVITGDSYSWQKVVVFINNSGTFVKSFETPEYLGIMQLGIEDLNSDGRPDLMFSHRVGNSTSNPHQYQLLYQTVNGGFVDSNITFSNQETSTMAYFRFADLNADGFKEILWSSSDNRYTDVLVNEGGMTFTKKESIIPVTYEMGVEDYTGDGNIDVMVRGNEGMNLYFGAGDFTFKEPKVIPVEYLSSTPSFVNADIDLNGLPDLVFLNGSYAYVLLNKGNGSFKASDIKLQGDWGTSIAITDFENDGDLDIVKLGNDGQHQGLNYFYENQLADINVVNEPPANPEGLSASYSAGKAVFTWLASTDDLTPAKLLTYNLSITDSDGKIFLSAETNASGNFRSRLGPGNAGHNTVMTLNNLPAGVYNARVQALDASFALSAWSQEVEFIIYDGPSDLAVERIQLNKVKLAWTSSAFEESATRVERKTVESAWEIIAELGAGNTEYVDANLEYNKLYQYRIFEASGEQTTSTSNIAEWSTNMWVLADAEMANTYGSIDVADFTADGRMDMVINGGMIYNGYYEDITKATFENTSDGWVKHDITQSTLPHTAELAFVDLNDDFKPDLYQYGYIWESGYKAETFLNNGNKSFSPSTNIFTDGTYSIQSQFDFDMDNDLDVTALKSDTYPSVQEVYRNNGGGNYTQAESRSCYTCPWDVGVADFDQDGDEDVLRAVNNVYELHLNTPEGLLSTFALSGYESQVFVTDYNNDGWPDIVLSTSSSYSTGKIYKNLGLRGGNTLQFEEMTVNLPIGESSFLSADLDHDGSTDLAIISPHVNVLLNKGNDAFERYSVPGFRITSHDSELIDFDNDGDLDIYLSGYHVEDYSVNGRKAKILLNQIIVSDKGIKNVHPDVPYDLSSTQDSLGVHLSWSIPDDDHTQPEGMTFDVVLYHDGKTITKGAHDPATGMRLRLAPGRSTGKATFNNLNGGSYSWRVQAVDGSFAGSTFSSEATFTVLPSPPVRNDTTIYACGRTVTLTAVGAGIQWYSDKEMTNLLASGEFHARETQTVYVVQNVNGLRGIPRRVRITILDKPPMPEYLQPNPLTACEYWPNVTLWASGENVRWYSDQALKNLISSQNDLDVPVADSIYFATQTIDGCKSNALTVEVQKMTIDSRLFYSNGNIRTRETEGEAYYWIKDGFYYKYTTEPYILFDGEIATYEVVIYKGSCQERSQAFISTVENIMAVEETEEGSWNLFPNPASTHVTLQVQSHSEVSVINAQGTSVYSTSLDNPGELIIDINQWIKGVYLVLVNDGKHISTKRLVIF